MTHHLDTVEQVGEAMHDCISVCAESCHAMAA